jgi:methylamine dehydrogenase accessory protein MauD
MSGLWLVSYLVLWVIVLGMAGLLYGALRQIGMLHLQLQRSSGAASEALGAAEAESIPPLEEDGPALGAAIPAWVAQQAGPTDEDQGRQTLLMFMSPLCETCQHVVEPLNALAQSASAGPRPIAIFRADRPAYEAFLKVFPMRLPTLRDHDRTLTMELGVHRAPFGLLYDESGILIRKGLVEGEEDLAALLGDESAPEEAQMHVYPRASSIGARA